MANKTKVETKDESTVPVTADDLTVEQSAEMISVSVPRYIPFKGTSQRGLIDLHKVINRAEMLSSSLANWRGVQCQRSRAINKDVMDGLSEAQAVTMRNAQEAEMFARIVAGELIAGSGRTGDLYMAELLAAIVRSKKHVKKGVGKAYNSVAAAEAELGADLVASVKKIVAIKENMGDIE